MTRQQRLSSLEHHCEEIEHDVEALHRQQVVDRLKWVIGILAVLIVATFAQSYQGRQDVINASRALCRAEIQDRFDTIKVRTVQARNDLRISGDFSVPISVRRARAQQAVVEWNSIGRLHQRVPPKLGCEKLFPNASPWPWG